MILVVIKAKKLISALLDGAILQKIHNKNDFLFGGTEYLYAFIQNEQIGFESKGFILPTKNPDERVIDVLKNPNDWEICERTMQQGPPYPWQN